MRTEPCGILHGKEPSFHDDDGCVLDVGHDGPHEFVDRDGQRWQWETDVSCECEHCMRCEGDYCTIYWRKDEASGEIEFQSWLAVLRTHGLAEAPAPSFQKQVEPWLLACFGPEISGDTVRPRQSTVFCQRVVQRGPTLDDPTLEVAYTVRRFTVTVWDFYRHRPEVQRG